MKVGENLLERIYVDHAATSPMHPQVLEVMTQAMHKPSEIHLAFISLVAKPAIVWMWRGKQLPKALVRNQLN